MRIDYYANIPAAANNNVGDLIGRLNTGDIIRAKVLEITSDEAVLKLFDGTVMRAGMLEAMNAKAGDTVMLAVSSKLEGTLYLETVRNLSQMTESNPETLKQLLETLQIKPDAQNIGLASELLKVGAPVTAEHLKQASELLNSNPALNIEKAVFLTLKGLDADRADVDLLLRLLEGNVKLGQQLKEVQNWLNQVDPAGANKSFASSSKPALTEQANLPVTNQTNSVGTNQVNAPQSNIAGTEKNSSELLAQIQITDNKTDHDTTRIASHSAAVNTDRTSTQISDLSFSTPNVSEEGLKTASDISAASRENAVSGMNSENPGNSASTDKAILGSASSASVQSGSFAPIKEESGNQINEARQVGKSAASERFSKLIEAVRDIFVKTDSEKLPSELDVNKINNKLNEKLELLKAAIDTSEGLESVVKEGLSSAAAQIDDTQRLLHQMNASNMLYYQVPVNLAGHDTTAELYVMNRRQNKKKIDPNDTVMFISLDTVNMGRVETLLDIKKSSITVNLRTESKKINDFIKTQIKDLYSGLAACGYKLVGVRYTVIDAATTPIQQERLLNGIARENYSKVDYRI